MNLFSFLLLSLHFDDRHSARVFSSFGMRLKEFRAAFLFALVKHNALSERKFGRIVECDRGPSAVLFPRVGAGLASTAGVLLAAKGASDFCR